MPQDQDNLIWIDLEMTGLDCDRDRIIEIATIVTDSNLKVVAKGPELVINQPAEALDGMDEWNTLQHGESGLTQRVRDSDLDDAGAQRLTLAFLSEHVPAGISPMCGNSICQDRRFLHRCMPELERYFHYRNLDVSTLKELCLRWLPAVAQRLTKQSRHRALDDVLESIEELRFYREHFLKLG